MKRRYPIRPNSIHAGTRVFNEDGTIYAWVVSVYTRLADNTRMAMIVLNTTEGKKGTIATHTDLRERGKIDNKLVHEFRP